MSAPQCRYMRCVNLATFTCLCTNQGFCAIHLGLHVQENPSAAHSTVPSIFRTGTEFSDFQTSRRDEGTEDPAVRWLLREKRRLEVAKTKALADLDKYHRTLAVQLEEAVTTMRERIHAQTESLESLLMRREAELRRGLAEEQPRTLQLEQLFHLASVFDSSGFQAFVQRSMGFSLTQVKQEDAFADYFAMHGDSMEEHLAGLFAQVLAGEDLDKISTVLVRPGDFQHVATLLERIKGLNRLSLSSGSLTPGQCATLAKLLVDHSQSLVHLQLMHVELNAEKLEELYEGLQGLKGLQSLVLAGNTLQDEGAKIVSDVVRDMRALETLDLSTNLISDLGANFIAQGLGVGLKSLNLSSNAIGVSGFKALCTGLKRVSALEDLDISDISLEAAKLYQVGEELQTIGTLRRLRIRDNQLNLEALRPAMLGLQSLLVLDLSSTYLALSDLTALSSILAALPALQRLRLSNVHIGYEGAVQISNGLATVIQLQRLDLTSCSLSKEAIIKLSIPLHRLQDMDKLQLAQNPLGRDGCPHLASALKKMTMMRKLNLAGCELVSVSFSALATAFNHLNLLEHLVLRDNAMGAVGASSLSSCLSFITVLRRLDLWNCELKEEAIVSLAANLFFLTKLEELNLGYNEFGPKGMKALAPALSKLTKLKVLNLWNVKLGPEGAVALAAALVRLSSLSELFLSSNGLGRDGSRSLSKSVCALTNLTRLLLSDNDLGDEGAIVLSQEVQHLPLLQHLCLFSNRISCEGARTVCIALSYLRKFRLLELQDNLDPSDDDIHSELKSILSTAEVVV